MPALGLPLAAEPAWGAWAELSPDARRLLAAVSADAARIRSLELQPTIAATDKARDVLIPQMIENLQRLRSALT